MISLQLRHLFRVVSGSTPKSGEPSYWGGGIPWVTPSDFDENTHIVNTRRTPTQEGLDSCEASVVPRGSLALTKRAPIGNVAILGVDACSNQGCLLLQPARNIDTKYYYYWLHSSGGLLKSLGRGSTFMELSTDDLKSLSIPTPSLSKQRAIADYLDAETARIDALIAAKEKLLALLAEKRKALITQAVTRGLDPSVPMRDSGIPWLGEIPAHWEVVPPRWFARIGSGDFISSNNVVPKPDGARVVPVVGGNGVIGYTDAVNSTATTVVIGRVGALCGNVHLIDEKAWITDNALRFREIRSFGAAYLQHLPIARDMNTLASRTAQPLITGNQVLSLRLPLPPRVEQRAIVKYIDTLTQRINDLAEATRASIRLLDERREALIAAAVTGQLDIPSKKTGAPHAC